MLPTELLSHRQNGESIVPLRLKIDAKKNDILIYNLNQNLSVGIRFARCVSPV